MKFFLIMLVTILLFSSFASARVSVMMVNQEPDPITAGNVVRAKFMIENPWEETKEDVIIEILPEYPFSLYSGEAKRNIGKMKGLQSGADAIILDFKLLVDTAAVDGDHNLDIKSSVGDTVVIYKDMFYIDVESEEIRLRTYIRSSDIITPGSTGKLSIEFANAGGYNIEFLESTLLPSNDYKLLSTSSYTYIGDLDSDDTESDEFQVYIPEETKEVNIPLKIVYEVNDQTYELEENLKLNLLSKEEAKSIGLIKENYTKNIVIGIIIGLISVFILRKIFSR